MNEAEILVLLMMRGIFLELANKADPINKQILACVDAKLSSSAPRYNIDLNQPAKGGKA